MFRLRELNMIDPNFRKQPPVAEGYSWSLPNPLITIWAEVVISFCGLYGVCQLKKKHCHLALVLCGLGMP